MHTYECAVLGASGYVGAELLRYLGRHPALGVVWVTGDRSAGRRLGDLYPHLRRLGALELAPTDPDAVPPVDVAFLALPHGAAAEAGRKLANRGVRVVDLAADWRLADPGAYERYYGWRHPYPEELGAWTFGLPELRREDLRGANRVANPGCYSTAALLALGPGVRDGLFDPEGMVVDGASGVSGAGRSLREQYLFSEVDGSFAAYGMLGHRHTPEIEQELALLAGHEVTVTFTPHLVPMARGLLATCYARTSATASEVTGALERAYAGEPFVHVLDRPPATKLASGTNHAYLFAAVDERTRTAVITCAIDNLGKGAAGQAVQNANLMLGLEETAGLELGAVYP